MTEVLLDGMFSRVVTPSGVIMPNTKSFVVDGELVIVGVEDRKAVVSARVPIREFTRSTRPRQTPHVVETPFGTYQVYEAGCGCGSPLKKFSLRQLSQVSA